MALQMNLPQMRSIWIDEDQEAEKLYGLQVQRLMDSDDDDQVDMMLINSDRPVLNNKERIELPPLRPSAYKPSRSKKPLSKASDLGHGMSSSKTKKTTGKFFKLFKSKEPRLNSQSTNISVPFNFQHISHADMKNVFEGERLSQDDPVSPISLNKAFVTESFLSAQDLPDKNKFGYSKTASPRRSSSIASSQYSSKSARIVSTSTMATSVNDDSYKSIKKLKQLERVHLKHRYNKSEDSAVSVEFLKNYSFPTVLEDVSLVEVKTPDMSKTNCDKFTWESPQDPGALLETMLQDRSPMPATTGSRRKSDSQLVFTPMIEQRGSFLDTPRTRKSVDDVLLCYHQPSEASSDLRESGDFSFSQSSGRMNNGSSWDKETETFVL
ncbi:LADA_0H10968g1_1 [Lachancea dasiensis]|uniref:LADA_0H10968g1_1 n=1 Tax=Lachancea dasiensis TaxID=1072105 RepID=A0A1G4K3A4_9SACH|nr:LADA_0H10968g1_1 [Lachancea dasiensis]